MGQSPSAEPLLYGDERIGFQIKEGPCSSGCNYCYETPPALDLIDEARSAGTISADQLSIGRGSSNRKIAQEVSRTPELQRILEMPVEKLLQYFRLLVQSGVNRAFLIGSEPTEHSHFSDILDGAQKEGVDLMVYTSGMHLDKLRHPAVRHIVLHVNEGPDSGFLQRQVTPEFINRVHALLDDGVTVDCRSNFSDARMQEAKMVFSFYNALRAEMRDRVKLKYSFTAKTAGDSESSHTTIDSLRAAAPALTSFVDQFRVLYPNTPMTSERPLFRCSFDKETWDKYAALGGFSSQECDMEFMGYNNGFALCAPTRNAVPTEMVETVEELQFRIQALRTYATEQARKPSFAECEPCDHRTNGSCQGGCQSYKL